MDVDNFGAEDVADLHNLGPSGGGGLHAQKDQFPIDDIPVFEVVDFKNVDQFIELFHHLFENLVIAHDHEGHARDFVVLGGADVESIDIKSAPAEKACDSGEDPEAILDYDRDGMAHKKRRC